MDTKAQPGLSLAEYTIIFPPQITPQIRGAMVKWLTDPAELSGGRYDVMDLVRLVESGRYQVWLAIDPEMGIQGVLTTSVSTYPGAKYLTMQFIGGEDIVHWKDIMLETVHNYAIQQGCVTLNGTPLVEFSGRRGWEKMLAPNGYVPAYTVYELKQDSLVLH